MTDPGAKRSVREAAEWHARLQSRFVSNDELGRFYEWRRDPENAGAFETVDTAWLDAARLGDDPDIAGAVTRAGRRKRRRWTEWAVAKRWFLGITATAVAAILAVFMLGSTGDVKFHSTERGETLVVRLDDGSELTLDADTRVAVRYRPGAREVELFRGQALFAVAHDATRPFRVTAATSTVTALGTEFTVRREDSGVSVFLVKGRISVLPSSGSTPVRLSATGEALVTSRSGTARRLRDPAAALSWVEGKIDLRDVPLAEALMEINRYAARPVVLDDQALSATEISGVFKTGDREAFVAAVTGLLPLRAVEGADGTVHLQAADDR